MRRWRFHQFAEHPRCGILVSPDGETRPAEFLTVEEAKLRAKRKSEAA